MTREQAKREIVSLDFYLLNHTDDYGEESHTAMMMAINALEELPKRRKEAKRWKTKAMQNNSCDDAISRQKMIDIVDSYSESQSNVEDVTQDMISDILALPPVTPKQRTGRWIYGEDNLGTGRDGWYCNQCGHFEFWDYSLDMKSAKLNLPNPCPNCGAKIEEQA